MIERNRGVNVDLDSLPLDDAETYKLFTRGDTTAIFQFESHGMRDILRRYQPTRIEDLTALNALYRPGPIQGGMIDDFINRKHGKKKVAYDLPQLKDILEETYGVILYQEQVMQIANRLAGFSLGEADILRRAMGKKKHEEMAAQRAKFMAGCAGNKIPEKKAERNLRPDGGIRGIRLQQVALLRVRVAGVSDGVPEDALPRGVHRGVADVGNGQYRESGEVHQRSARDGHYGSAAGRELERSVFHAGGRGDPFWLARSRTSARTRPRRSGCASEPADRFNSLYEFCERIEVRFLNKRVFESLIKSGAMDSMGARESMVASIDDAVAAIQRAARIESRGKADFSSAERGEPGAR